MKTLITTLFILTVSIAYSQKTKRMDVTSNAMLSVSCKITYDEDNNPSDTVYFMIGRDSRYTAIYESIIIKHGSLKEIYDLMNYGIEFFKNEDDGTSMDFEGNHLSIMRYSGIKTILIYGMEDDSRGYSMCNRNQMEKIKAGIDLWMGKNKVKI